MNDSRWGLVLLAIPVGLLVAACPAFVGSVLGVVVVGGFVVLVIAGFVHAVQVLHPPGWAMALYVVSWLVCYQAALGVSIALGLYGGLDLIEKKLSD